MIFMRLPWEKPRVRVDNMQSHDKIGTRTGVLTFSALRAAALPADLSGAVTDSPFIFGGGNIFIRFMRNICISSILMNLGLFPMRANDISFLPV
jgi:hypothetical protein